MLGIIVRSSHPAPTFAVTTLTLLLTIAFGLRPLSAAVIVVAVFFNQIAVGLSNDVIDLPRDRRAGRADKPLVTGVLSTSTAWWIVASCTVLSLALSAMVNLQVAVWQAVFLLSGFVYNAGLKATVFSAIPYATGFAALPALVSWGAQPPGLPGWWVMLVAAMLGVSAHFANVLPDSDSDRIEGIRGLPQRASSATTATVLVCLTSLSSIFVILQAGASAAWVTVPIGVGAIVVSGAAAWLTQRTTSTQWPFRLSMVAAGLITLGLIGALRLG